MIKSHKDKIIPKELILSSAAYLKQLEGTPPKDIWCHIGSDLIKGGDGQYYVLEDNRCPSGVSYMLKTERSLKELF
jgi:uncharacterized circularly permuted ATP-grasp superfamily protein